MNAGDSLVIFDFDGVIVNSVLEVAVTAFNAVAETKVYSLVDLPSGYLNLFVSERHMVCPAGDFIPFAECCLESLQGGPVVSVESFEHRRSSQTRPLKARTEAFFDSRSAFIEAEPHEWLSLHKVYEPLFSALSKDLGKNLVVLTNKNRAAVRTLLEHFGLEINWDWVYSGDGGASKQQNFELLRGKHPSGKYYFVDDSLQNLISLRRYLGEEQILTPLLALWGYVGPNDPDEAESAGIECISQQELIELARRCQSG